jgi:tetratricopeptide (TPR) repeat protein
MHWAGVLDALYVQCLDRPPARWMDDINSRFGDITEALAWSFEEHGDDGDVRVGCRLVGALGLWWPRSGRNRDARRWIGRAFERIDEVEDTCRSRLLIAAGSLEYADRATGLAHRHFLDAADAADRAGLRTHRSLALAGAGAATDPTAAATSIELVAEAVALARQLGMAGLLARTLDLLGEVNRRHGRLDEAVDCYRESLELNRENGDRYAEAVNLANLGLAAEAKGDDPTALRFGVAGLEASWRVGSRVMAAWSLSELAGPVSRLGDLSDAARLIGASDAVLSALEVERGVDEQPIYEITQTQIEERLGTPLFLEHVTTGQRMDIEDAIAFALDAAAGALDQ